MWGAGAPAAAGLPASSTRPARQPAREGEEGQGAEEGPCARGHALAGAAERGPCRAERMRSSRGPCTPRRALPTPRATVRRQRGRGWRGGAVRPPAAPPHPLPRRASRGEGADEGLAGGCQGPASPSAVLTSPASPRAAPTTKSPQRRPWKFLVQRGRRKEERERADGWARFFARAKKFFDMLRCVGDKNTKSHGVVHKIKE